MSGSASVRRSKWLSRHLRHSPDRIGLDLEPGGWVAVEDLLAAAAAHGMPMSRSQLDEVVAGSDKQRFAFSPDGSRIRANQGHSIAVDLGLEPRQPPAVLFHGTGERSVESILAHGLDRRRRHHVHLSADEATATKVGARHGRPVVLRVDAAAMSAAGFEFLVSDNGVWLCASVPAAYLTVVEQR
jgi:putative RNA 2'-phosphotransferase